MELSTFNEYLRQYFYANDATIQPIRLDNIIQHINKMMFYVVVDEDLTLPNDLIKFDPILEQRRNELSLATLVDLQPYPEDSLQYAFDALSRCDTKFANDMHVYRWVCKVADTYCEKNALTPNWNWGRKLAKKLGITPLMPRGIPIPQKEDQDNEIRLKLVAKLSGVSMEKITEKIVSAEEWVGLTDAAELVSMMSPNERLKALNG